MGIFHSRRAPKETRDSNISPNETQTYDDEVVNRMRKELYENPEMFLVNNILMSIQFYENFEREMEDLRKNQVSDREIELNKALTPYRKHCLLPDTVMECINERVRFRPFHGQKKFESQPLLHQRMFIVHDNIEILYEGETSEYSTVDGPIHRAVLEHADNKGYVQLRQVEFLNVGKNEEDSDSSSIRSDEVEEPVIDKSPKEKSVTFNTGLSSSPSTPGKQRLFSKTNASPIITKENQFPFPDNTPSESRRSSLIKSKILRNHSFNFALTSSPKPSLKMKESVSVENIHKEVETSSSKPMDNDEDYGYTTLRRITASKPLDEVRSHRDTSDITGIPSYCLKEIKVRKIIEDIDDEDSDDSIMEDGRRKPPKKKKIQDFYDIKKYFNSLEFVGHFGDVYETLYPILGFTRESFGNAMVQRGKIYCEGTDRRGNKIMYEIIPTAATSWPEIAFEWSMRKRAAISDPITKKIYQWPTDLMTKKIRSLQANVLPLGYVAKRGVNEKEELEWSLAFPAAERYMETCMSHSQIRCYLFILTLYKTFMEPCNTKLGLTAHHILHIIFWECERNFITWPEDRLGTKMIKILNILYNNLSRGHLPDYFVRERNLFESLPGKYLRISQSKLHDIIERPVVHVLLAMRNLRYTSGNFFPPLNFKNLYSIITKYESLSLINPTLSLLVENNTVEETMEERNEFKENAVAFWTSAKKTEDRERQWKRKLRKQIDLENKEKQNLKQIKRASVDSIDLQINVPRFDTYKKRCLLEFFIIHFLDVATKCFQYKSYNYAVVILEHTHSLAILLGEEPSGEVEARPHKRKINELIDKCLREQQHEARPQVDNNRDSQNFAGVRYNLDNHTLNLGNLHTTFVKNNNQEIVREKKRPENIKIPDDHVALTSKSEPSPKTIVLEDNHELNDDTYL